MAGPSLSNLALVEARFADGTNRVSTGYFLGPDRVLTARHVLGELGHDAPTAIEVRQESTGRWIVAALGPAWELSGVDAVVFALREAADGLVDVVVGDSLAADEPVTWTTTAYPGVARRPTSTGGEGTVRYATTGLQGTWHPQGGRGQGTRSLDLGVDDPPNDWHGISGAPVFVDGRMIGIVDSAPLDFENRRLTAVPIEHVYGNAELIAAVTPNPHAVPDAPVWFLVLLAERASDRTTRLVASAIDKLERTRLGVDDTVAVALPAVVVVADEELTSPGRWLNLVELMARAPVMIVDITGFQPAVMTMLGVRAVARRGVTVTVTREQLTEANLQDLPFNIQETRLVSLASSDAGGRGGRDRLVEFISQGLRESARTDYLDLPVYDAVRCRRPGTEAATYRPALVLCPFDAAYDGHWRFLADTITMYESLRTPVRMLDIASPRLVGQALYEQIRWNPYCIVDWTHWRPNVFFEFGVRLACSRVDPILVIDEAELEAVAGDGVTPLRQRTLLGTLFRPAPYCPGADDNPRLERAFRSFRDLLGAHERPLDLAALPPAATRDALASAYDWAQERFERLPHEKLQSEIEARLGRDPQMTATETDVLFSSNPAFAGVMRASIQEDWLAAWFYAVGRFGGEARTADGALRQELTRLGEFVKQALRGSDDLVHVRVRAEITAIIDEWEDQQ